MNIQIKHDLDLVLCGAAKKHLPEACFGDDIRELLDQVWPVVRERALSNDGINHVVYEEDGAMFAGLRVAPDDAARSGLATRHVHLAHYAWFKHVGPYKHLARVGQEMREELAKRGLQACSPSLEIYGHWQEDASKLETEVICRIEKA